MKRNLFSSVTLSKERSICFGYSVSSMWRRCTFRGAIRWLRSVIYLAHFQNEVSAILCHGTSLPSPLYFQRKTYQCESGWFPIELRCLCLLLSQCLSKWSWLPLSYTWNTHTVPLTWAKYLPMCFQQRKQKKIHFQLSGIFKLTLVLAWDDTKLPKLMSWLN